MPPNLFVFGEEWTYFKSGRVTIAGRSKICENMFSEGIMQGFFENEKYLDNCLSDISGEEKQKTPCKSKHYPLDNSS